MLFDALRRALAAEDGRQIVAQCTRGLCDGAEAVTWLGPMANEIKAPYPELGTRSLEDRISQRADVVFLTGRFRSGSTLLWNIFRHAHGCTAYYEPFNERRWFDPLARGHRVDPTHRGVSDYWREYEGLGELSQWYEEDWTRRHLYMGSDLWMPRMKRYVEILIERAAGRPVFQFNRVDFRLPWLRRNFPEAFIVHLYRHPRDQWCSTLGDPQCFGPHDPLEAFHKHDKYYLQPWVRDLRHLFPFLDDGGVQHPYEWFYYLWKLSYLFGIKFADQSVAFEDLVHHDGVALRGLLDQLHVEYDFDGIRQLVQKPEQGRWRMYAEDNWFRKSEEKCEQTLSDFWSSDRSSLLAV